MVCRVCFFETKDTGSIYHSGSVGIIMSGWLGAANYGVIQSHEVEAFLEKGMR